MSKKTSAWDPTYSYAPNEDTSASPELLYSQIAALNTAESTNLTVTATSGSTT